MIGQGETKEKEQHVQMTSGKKLDHPAAEAGV